MPVPRGFATPRHAPAGFSIVEMLVALMLLAVGLLAVAATAVLIARMQHRAASRSLAAALAESRLELVRAARCAAASGDSSIGPLAERWELAPVGGSVRELADSIDLGREPGGASRRVVFRSAVPC